MASRVCSRCGKEMKMLEGEYVLLGGADVPGRGSKSEIMVTPRDTLRVRVWECQDAGCGTVELVKGQFVE